MDVWISERYKLSEPWRMLRLIHRSVGLQHFIILLSNKLVSFRLRTLQQRFPHSIPTMHLHLGGLGMIWRQWPLSPLIEVAEKRTPGVSIQIPFKGLLNDPTLASCYLRIRGNHFQMKGDIPNKYTHYIRCIWDWLLRVPPQGYHHFPYEHWVWMAGQEFAGQPAGALPLWCEDLTRIVQWKQVTQYDTCMTHIYASSSRSEYNIYDIISNALKPELQKKSYSKCDPLHVLDEVEWITHWCSRDCPQPATSFRRTLSFLRSVRDIVCRSSALWQEMALGEWGRQALGRRPTQLDAQQMTKKSSFGQLKFQWAYLNKWSFSGNSSSSPNDDLTSRSDCISGAQRIMSIWPPGRSDRPSKSSRCSEGVWRRRIESVRLSRTWQACQPDTSFSGHMSRLIFRFSLGIAGPFKIGDRSFVFWWCKKLTQKNPQDLQLAWILRQAAGFDACRANGAGRSSGYGLSLWFWCWGSCAMTPKLVSFCGAIFLQSEVIPTRCYHLVELGSESMEVVPVWHQIWNADLTANTEDTCCESLR